MLKRLSLIVLLLLVGCSQAQRLDGYLYLRLGSDPSTLDPAHIVDVTGGAVSAKIFSGLVCFDKDADVVPDAAAAWEISQDGRAYTFHIRQGVRFSNGREVAASDFKYSFERVLSPDTRSPRTWLFDRIKGARAFMDGTADEVSGIKAVDERTLVIELDAPFGPFLGLLAMPAGYVVPREEVERPGEGFSDRPVGSGPYVLSSWEHGSSLTLRANPEYWAGMPSLAGIVYRLIPEDLTAVAEFERGGLDVLGIPAPELMRYTRGEKWRGLVHSQVGLNTYYLGLNCSRPPFNDVRLRRAVAMAIDVKRILDTVYERRGVQAVGPVPPMLYTDAGGDSGDTAAPPPCPYDPEGARRLITEAGHPDGFAMSIYIGGEQETLDMVEVIQQYLADAGIRASIVQLEWSAYKQAINTGDADAFWLSWQADYPDPENFLYPVFHSDNFGSAGNRARFSDPGFDRLIEKAQAEPDGPRRMALYRAAEARVVELSPWVFFWHKKDFVVRHGYVEGFSLFPINNADKGLGIRIAKNH